MGVNQITEAECRKCGNQMDVVAVGAKEGEEVFLTADDIRGLKCCKCGSQDLLLMVHKAGEVQ